MPSQLRVALVQADLVWEQPAINRQRIAHLLQSLDASVDLIVLPEMFTTGFSMHAARLAEPPGGPTTDWLLQLAEQRNALLLGSVITQDDSHYFNRLLAVGPDGLLGYYDKRHRFTLAGEDKHYTAGTQTPVLTWRGWRILPQICYDLRFPVWSRRTPNQDYDLLVYVANWPEPRSHHWRRLLPARAIENQCCVAAVNRVGTDEKGHNYVGDSVILDWHGEVVADVLASQEGITLATLDLDALQAYRTKYAFAADADRFTIQL